MPTFITPRKAGRPPRHPVDELRTRLWLHVLKRVSGCASAYALEMALEPGAEAKRIAGSARPRKWDCYQKGTRVPSRMGNKPYPVEVAEAKFPGAAAYFESPIWPILRKERQSKEWIEAQLRGMSPAITSILLSDRVPEFGTERQFREFNEESAAKLATVGTFEALAAMVLLVAKSEVIASPDLRELALRAYSPLRLVLERNDDMAPFMAELCLLIDTTCKHWVFVTTQSRLDIVIFSSEIPRPSDDEGLEP